MGLECIQENMREGISRAFNDKAYILGMSRTSHEIHLKEEWPDDDKSRRLETVNRIYDL